MKLTPEDKIVLQFYIDGKPMVYPWPFDSEVAKKSRRKLARYGLIVRGHTGTYRFSTPDEIVQKVQTKI